MCSRISDLLISMKTNTSKERSHIYLFEIQTLQTEEVKELIINNLEPLKIVVTNRYLLSVLFTYSKPHV